MRDTKRQRMIDWYARMNRAGFDVQDADALRRIEMTLTRWSEQECGDSNAYGSWAIERNEAGKPYMVRHSHQAPFKTTQYPIPDREAGALRRLALIMARHPEWTAYHQSDPRGCALYVVRKADIPADTTIDCVYNRGIAVGY